MSDKRRVHFWEYPLPTLIYPCSSGIIFEAQAGGGACTHPEVEGVILPIQLQDTIENFLRLTSGLEEMDPGCHGQQIKTEEANELDLLFVECEIPLVVNRDRMKESTEAWLHVRIRRKDERWLPAKSEKEIQEFIAAAKTFNQCYGISEDEKRIRAIFDACRAGDWEVLGDFAGEEAILTWCNCD